MKTNLLTKILIGLNLLNPTPTKEQPKEVELNKQMVVIMQQTMEYNEGIKTYWYGETMEGDYQKTLLMGNEYGDKVTITMDTYKDIYNMEYVKDGETIKYHYHDINDLQDDIEKHQEYINNDYEGWEKVEEVDEVRKNEARDFSNEARTSRVSQYLNTSDYINKGVVGFEIEYPIKGAYGKINNEEEYWQQQAKHLEDLKTELIIYDGFDIEYNIDYTVLLGEDWKCKIQTEEGKKIVDDYLNNR